MDESVIRAVAKWPNVPAVYGWLSLDRRGDWRLQGERLTHRGAVAFINRNYASDVRGCWYVQNGPQRVYVTLEYTPWVYALTAQGELVSHNGRLVDALESAWIDDAGCLLLVTPHGAGVVDDRDLDAFSERLNLGSGARDPGSLEAAVRSLQTGRPTDLILAWKDLQLPVGFVPKSEVARRFCFDPQPRKS
jgi:hypothetical protein